MFNGRELQVRAEASPPSDEETTIIYISREHFHELIGNVIIPVHQVQREICIEGTIESVALYWEERRKSRTHAKFVS